MSFERYRIEVKNKETGKVEELWEDLTSSEAQYLFKIFFYNTQLTEICTITFSRQK